MRQAPDPLCDTACPIWLVSDARNDAALERVLARLPRGSGLIFRHYHLPTAERRARFAALARVARRRGHLGRAVGQRGPCPPLGRGRRLWPAAPAGTWPRHAAPRHRAFLRELAAAQRSRADAVLLSPVFSTRSHPGAPARWVRQLSPDSGRAREVPVIALGGMNLRRAQRLGAAHWAAIDGLCE